MRKEEEMWAVFPANRASKSTAHTSTKGRTGRNNRPGLSEEAASRVEAQ